MSLFSLPTKGASFTAPATVEIIVEASDPDGTISKVELYNGSKKIAESTDAPYYFTVKDYLKAYINYAQLLRIM